jgi:hypothetical protein
MKARSIGFDKKSKPEIIDKIFQDASSSTSVPPITIDDCANIRTEDMSSLISTWQSCMCALFFGLNSIVIMREIKLFLTYVNVCDKIRREKAKNKWEQVPCWKSKYNHLTLLNLGDTTIRYGNLRSMTELDRKGEGSIQLLKVHMGHGLKGKWAYNVALKYYQSKSFDAVIKNTEKKNEKKKNNNKRNRYRHTY